MGNNTGAVYSSKAEQMMRRMGYTKGEGLGAHGQGRTVPVDASAQRGRRGLGLTFAGTSGIPVKYDPSKEACTVEEEVTWLVGNSTFDVSEIDFHDWMVMGKKKRILDDEVHFCDPEMLKNILACKSILDNMSDDEIRRARNRSNPFERIKGGIFLNRAAMKMANMDKVFDFMFTNPVDKKGKRLVDQNHLLFFADVCAGPGGFSEYVLWRKGWKAKGFGFTLKGDNDFKLDDFYAGPCESFEPFYGHHEDGDIFKMRNIISFTEFVMKNTGNKGVHFMMADGGFSVAGQENIQEILSKQLYLCQCLVALSIVREGGHFVCKLFDIFTPFSAGIIYLMHLCFDRISIHKPNTSRPANSERYIICKWKNSCTEHVRDYMFKINETICKTCGSATEDDVTEIVPIKLLKRDEDFYDYLYKSNNSLGERQVNCLAKFSAFLEDSSLTEDRQSLLRSECLKYWNVPCHIRKEQPNEPPEVWCRKTMDNDTLFLRNKPRVIKTQEVEDMLFPIFDWYMTYITSKEDVSFYLGVSHRRTYKYDSSQNKWIAMFPMYNIELSPNTLVYGELVQEVTGTKQAQRKSCALHIIDGFMLGGESIAHLHYSKRLYMCSLYATSITRESICTLLPIRMKAVYELESIESATRRLEPLTMKNIKIEIAYPLDKNGSRFFIPKGITFIKATALPYRRYISQTTNYKYYHAEGKPTVFDKDRPDEAIASFRHSYENSLIWYSPDSTNLDDGRPIYKQEFVKFLTKHVNTSMHRKPVEETIL